MLDALSDEVGERSLVADDAERIMVLVCGMRRIPHHANFMDYVEKCYKRLVNHAGKQHNKEPERVRVLETVKQILLGYMHLSLNFNGIFPSVGYVV